MTTFLPPVRLSPAAPTWAMLADALDIARSLYQRAAERHASVGEWLCRPESSLARFGPRVRPQGSFRFGTVIKPIVTDATYDLDQVVVFEQMGLHEMSQAELKRRFGAELAAYARARAMQPPEEKHRCWRLHYRDDVSFHLDSVPCVPASAEAVWDLRRQGVTDEWAPRAVAITDDRHPQYDAVAGAWLTSNPRGFARWFEAQAALGRPREHDRVAVASVEDVPAYEWRTPLQRAVQLLKRHRDVHFRQRPELAPISMIITNLAARAYQGELDLGEALVGIVDRMELFVNPVAPRIPNPTHPAEDYADKWRIRPDLQLERNFRLWMAQVRADVRNIAQEPANLDQLEKRFDIALSGEQRLGLTAAAGTAAARATATVPRVHTGPRPWRAL